MYEEIRNEINRLINKSGEDVSMIIKDIKNNDIIYSLNSNKKVVSASTIKVQIMLAIYNEVQKGNANLSDTLLILKSDILDDTKVFENGEGEYTLEELINWMIINSDNTATNVLLKKFGIDHINIYITDVLKLKSTYLERYMLDSNAINEGLNNYTCELDMLSTFEKIINKEILNETLCLEAINILYNQRCKDKLLRYIYAPVKFAHKTGSLDYLCHDIGIMNLNDSCYYIGVSIVNSKKIDGNKSLMGRIGKSVYEYLINSKDKVR